GARGITANVVAPGFIETAMTAELPEATQKQYLAGIPAARFGQAEEIAEAVTYLASPEAGYVRARSSRSTAASAWGTEPTPASTSTERARQMGLLDGKKLLVTGALMESSIAFNVARLAQEQ